MRLENDCEKARRCATYVKGMADATDNETLETAAELLNKLADNMCGQGYVGCHGGEDCGSDHK